MRSLLKFVTRPGFLLCAMMLALAVHFWWKAETAWDREAALMKWRLAAEEPAPSRLAGPSDVAGWDFSGTALSDEAWKLPREGESPSDGRGPALSLDEGDFQFTLPGTLPRPDGEARPETKAPADFPSTRKAEAYLPEAVETPLLHRGDLQDVTPAALLEPKPVPAPQGSE